MGIFRDLFYLSNRAGRQAAGAGVSLARQMERDNRRLAVAQQQWAVQDYRDQLASDLTGTLYRLLEELRRRRAIRPRHRHQDAKLSHQAVVVWSSDRVSTLFRRTPRRSAICFPYGVWLGLYATEGEFWVLAEVQGAVSCIARYADRADADHSWAALEAYCAQLNRIPQ